MIILKMTIVKMIAINPPGIGLFWALYYDMAFIWAMNSVLNEKV